MPHLIERSKWRTIQRNIRRGDLVLIVEDNVPRGQWRLGRVIAPIASADGLVRSAEVVTKTGTYVRPVGKLALLRFIMKENEALPGFTPRWGCFEQTLIFRFFVVDIWPRGI